MSSTEGGGGPAVLAGGGDLPSSGTPGVETTWVALLEMLSHDLRSPLTSISIWTELLRTKRDPAAIARGLDIIARSTRTQLRLLDQAVDLGSMLGTSLVLAREPLSMSILVEDVARELREQAPERAIEVRIEPPSGDFVVSGDPRRLRQLIRDLVTSWMRLLPSGALRLSLTPTDGYVQLRFEPGDDADAALVPLALRAFECGTTSADGTDRRTVERRRIVTLQVDAARRIAEAHGGSIEPATGGGPGLFLQVRLARALPSRSAKV